MTIQRYDIGFGALKGPDYQFGQNGVDDGTGADGGENQPDSGSPPSSCRSLGVLFDFQLSIPAPAAHRGWGRAIFMSAPRASGASTR